MRERPRLLPFHRTPWSGVDNAKYDAVRTATCPECHFQMATFGLLQLRTPASRTERLIGDGHRRDRLFSVSRTGWSAGPVKGRGELGKRNISDASTWHLLGLGASSRDHPPFRRGQVSSILGRLSVCEQLKGEVVEQLARSEAVLRVTSTRYAACLAGPIAPCATRSWGLCSASTLAVRSDMERLSLCGCHGSSSGGQKSHGLTGIFLDDGGRRSRIPPRPGRAVSRCAAAPGTGNAREHRSEPACGR